ncbi:MAG: cache domain-containing protein [Pseudomonadota bacterium]|nr:cache domain-containing protein [Pseudomonadota bacterium]
MTFRTRAWLTLSLLVLATIVAVSSLGYGLLNAQMERARLAAVDEGEAVLNAIELDIQRAASEIKTWSAVSDVTGTAASAADRSKPQALARWESQRYLQSDAAKFLRDLSLLSERRFKEIFFTDARGYVVASTNPTSDFDQGPEEDPPLGEGWWRDARAEGWNIGELEYDQSSTFYSIDISVSLTDDKSFVGVLKAVYGTTAMLAILDQASAGHGGHVVLVDASGAIVLAPTHLSATVGNAAMGVSGLKAFTGDAGHAIETVPWGGRSLVTRIKPNGRTYVDQAGWTALTVIPLDQALLPASARQQLGLIGAGAFIAIAIALALAGLHIIHHSAGPMGELTQAILRIARGRGDMTIPHQEAGGELGALAQCLARITTRLRKYDIAYARHRRRMQAARPPANDAEAARRRRA